MTKSKLVAANKKIENTVMNGYQKIENSVVSSYQKVEDKFIDHFLRQDDETIEEAKKRINKEQKDRQTQNNEHFNNIPKYTKTTEEIQMEIKEKYGN